jgi:hypothetical protein
VVDGAVRAGRGREGVQEGDPRESLPPGHAPGHGLHHLLRSGLDRYSRIAVTGIALSVASTFPILPTLPAQLCVNVCSNMCLVSPVLSCPVLLRHVLRAGMDLIYPKAGMKSFAEKLPSAAVKYSREVSKFSRFNVLLVAVTAMSGAFVAGNDAGRAFNTFPLMGDTWIPEGVLDMEPEWRNFFENTATVQFDHRCLAIGTYISVFSMALEAYRRSVWPLLPSLTRKSMMAIFAVANAQVALGITTLLLYVPIELAALHQVSMCRSVACGVFIGQ